jgi:hypothetical protein
MTTTKPNLQIDDLVREMTDEEYTEYKAQQKAGAAAEAQFEAKIAARENALSKLAALGLTAEEIGAL